jgi:hypothetical protein
MKTYSFTGPLNKEQDVAVDKKAIARLFNQPILLGDSGTARLRKGNQTGEILEEFDVHSEKVSASGRELVLFPEKPFPYGTEIFLTIDDGFVISKVSGEKCNFLNENSEITHSFTTEDPIGKSLDGGIIISKSGGRYLIVSPKKAEISLFWEEKEKAITHTEKITGTSGWFVPSLNLLMNEDLNARNVWFKSEDDNIFWTNDDGFGIDMNDLIPLSINKNTLNRVRTFKFVGV